MAQSTLPEIFDVILEEEKNYGVNMLTAPRKTKDTNKFIDPKEVLRGIRGRRKKQKEQEIRNLSQSYIPEDECSNLCLDPATDPDFNFSKQKTEKRTK